MIGGMNTEIKIYEKPVIVKYVSIDGEEFCLDELFCCINEIRNTEEGDNYGDYSLRGYELSYPNTMDKLVKMGLVKNYTGSRMANLYCMKDEAGIDRLVAAINELGTD